MKKILIFVDNVTLIFKVNDTAFPINVDPKGLDPLIEEYIFSLGNDWTLTDNYEGYWGANNIFKAASRKSTDNECKNITITATRAPYQQYTCVYKILSPYNIYIYRNLDWSFIRI
ncbi:MAG: hypothetical protein K0R49_161 [Burkholderiales bacterium]|jgi:hypothetical protein|nr:hypothetical protein [Burkholderiales bacterium]